MKYAFNFSQHTVVQLGVIKEVVLSEAPKVNDLVMNRK